MELFEQVFLSPGEFPLDDGRTALVTADDIRDHVNGTNTLLGEGWQPPVLFEHAPKGSQEGSPRKRDTKAAEVKHGAGWLKEVKIGPNGEGIHVLEVTDPVAIKGLKNKSIKFTSPELRSKFLGRDLMHVAHVALTHKPRFTKQGPIEPIQLSLAGECLQFAMGDEEDGGDKKPDPPADEKPDENPDAPAQDNKADQQFQALLAQLKEVSNIDLPSDATPDTLVRDLLTALKTAAAHKAADAEKDADTEDDEPGTLTEERPPVMQFSISDVDGGKLGNKLLAKVIKQAHASQMGRLDKLVESSQIAPSLREKLAGNTAIQFSADADELASFTLDEVIGLLEEHTLPGQAWGFEATQLSVEAPNEPAATGEITPEMAKKIVDEQAKSIPMLRK